MAHRARQDGAGLSRRPVFHTLFLDGGCIERSDGSLCFRWLRAPTSAELTRLTQTLALRIGRYLERQGLLESDVENSYLTGDAFEAGPMKQLLGSSITYRINAPLAQFFYSQEAGPIKGARASFIQTAARRSGRCAARRRTRPKPPRLRPA